MPDQRIVFPCGAYYPLNEWPIDGAHYAADGAVRFMVSPGTLPFLGAKTLELVKRKSDIDYDGDAAPCRFFCPTPKRRQEQRGFALDGTLGTYVSCFGRLWSQAPLSEGDDGWCDITPIKPAKCPHCVEQSSYEAACRLAAKRKVEGPSRERWRLCPQCERHAELTADTGLCRVCLTPRLTAEREDALLEELQRLLVYAHGTVLADFIHDLQQARNAADASRLRRVVD